MPTRLSDSSIGRDAFRWDQSPVLSPVQTAPTCHTSTHRAQVRPITGVVTCPDGSYTPHVNTQSSGETNHRCCHLSRLLLHATRQHTQLRWDQSPVLSPVQTAPTRHTSTHTAQVRPITGVVTCPDCSYMPHVNTQSSGETNHRCCHLSRPLLHATRQHTELRWDQSPVLSPVQTAPTRHKSTLCSSTVGIADLWPQFVHVHALIRQYSISI